MWGVETARTGRVWPKAVLDYIDRSDEPHEQLAALLEVMDAVKKGDDQVLAKLLLREKQIQQHKRDLYKERITINRITDTHDEYKRRSSNQLRRYATFIRRQLPAEKAARILRLDQAAGVSSPTPVQSGVDVDEQLAAIQEASQEARRAAS